MWLHPASIPFAASMSARRARLKKQQVLSHAGSSGRYLQCESLAMELQKLCLHELASAVFPNDAFPSAKGILCQALLGSLEAKVAAPEAWEWSQSLSQCLRMQVHDVAQQCMPCMQHERIYAASAACTD